MADDDQHQVSADAVVAEADGGDNNISTGATGLRRSKRNKYHLDVAAILRTGSSAHRDYSPPPAKMKWASRKPEPSPHTKSESQVQSPKKVSPKRSGGIKKELVLETANADDEKTMEAPVSKEEVKEGHDATKEPVETNEERNTQEEEERSLKVEPVHQPQTIVSSGLRNVDIQLPDQLLEEDDYAANPIAPKEISGGDQPGAAQAGQLKAFNDIPTAGTSSLAVNSEVKRKRKVPLRHLDYTNGDSDVDEDRFFKRVKVEYTMADGSRVNQTNSTEEDHLQVMDDQSCPKCPAVFESRVGLKNHMKLHGAKKAFPCELCDFSCTNKKTMRQHRRVHGIVRKSKKSHEKPDPQQLATPVPSPISPETTSKQAEAGNSKCGFVEENHEEMEEEFVVIKSLDEIQLNGSDVGDNSIEDAMPVLEEQERNTGGAVENIATKSRTNKKSSLGYRKKGSRHYNRNTVTCPYCPYITQSKVRLEPHILGHTRKTGFVCSICGFKSELSGILRRHCQLHKDAPIKWPADYIGIFPTTSATTSLVEQAEEADSPRTNDQKETHERGDLLEAAKISSKAKCWREKYSSSEAPTRAKLVARYHLQRQNLTHMRTKNGHPRKLCKYFCCRCGLLFCSGPFALALHNRRHHAQMNDGKKAFYAELLAERLAWRPEKESILDEQSSNLLNQSIQSPSSLAQEKLNQQDDSPSNSKIFHCQKCPFTTDQIFRLQKHENKHLVKSEHQCVHCSFSCRSMDILAQHLRLHDTFLPSNQPISSSNSTSIESETNPQKPLSDNQQQEAPKLLSIRRNETHYCTYCPYKTKHNCDMKAHLKMHVERRKFTCSHCTYSTMRQNALIAHEKLHQAESIGKGRSRRLKAFFYHGQILGRRLQLLSNENYCFYRCAEEKCAAEYSFCSDLAKHGRHHLTEWTASKSLNCTVCGFKTDSENIMHKHRLVHRGEEEKNMRSIGGVFQCKDCPYATANYAKFWNHRQKHKKLNRFACTFCNFSTGSIQCYTEHLELHSGNEEGAETTNGKHTEMQTIESSSAGEAKITLQKQPAPMFNKEKYEQINAALSVVQLKQRSVVGTEADSNSVSSSTSSDKNSKTKNCAECPYRTSDSVLLKIHAEMHRPNDSRPFSCNLCSLGCFSAESLHTHLSLHNSIGKEVEEHPRARGSPATMSRGSSSSYQCSQCNFKCSDLDGFLSHRKEHVQLLQQRLMTIIKRSTNESNVGTNGLKDKMKLMRGLRSDKQHYCPKCSFKCDSVQAFALHWEHHKSAGQLRHGIFKCSVCDYNSDTKNVVIFHEKNHHLDVPLSSLCQSIQMEQEKHSDESEVFPTSDITECC